MGESSVLLCRAPHPRQLRGDGRFEGRLCGKRLQVVPFKVRPTYRAIHDWSEVHPGCIAVRCLASDCRAFTEYKIIGDLHMVETGGMQASVPKPIRKLKRPAK